MNNLIIFVAQANVKILVKKVLLKSLAILLESNLCKKQFFASNY